MFYLTFPRMRNCGDPGQVRRNMPRRPETAPNQTRLENSRMQPLTKGALTTPSDSSAPGQCCLKLRLALFTASSNMVSPAAEDSRRGPPLAPASSRSKPAYQPAALTMGTPLHVTVVTAQPPGRLSGRHSQNSLKGPRNMLRCDVGDPSGRDDAHKAKNKNRQGFPRGHGIPVSYCLRTLTRNPPAHKSRRPTLPPNCRRQPWTRS